MERGLYTAATGMSIADRWMDVISNNLANASTTAFKRDVLVFNESLERQIAATGTNGQKVGSIGAGPSVQGVFTDWESGPMSATGNALDLAIANGQGLFQISTPQGNFYTRNGSFTIGQDRLLITKEGYPVLDENGATIKIPAGKLTIANDGTVDVEGQRIGRIALHQGDFTKTGSGLYSSTNASPLTAAQTNVVQGALEGSNVNAIEEMVAMIKLNRAFEMAQKSAQSSDESTQRLIQILQDR
ncbi:flagellar hook-basal body protein [Kamptonema cortianum]|nr:flagellar hook-basal body protein [Geitlerinema splendidum]MDK3161094.1 flagellar hook-basal body protein [Kamptonema cortianum]